MRTTDVVLAFPALLVAIALVAIVGPEPGPRHRGHRRWCCGRPRPGSSTAPHWSCCRATSSLAATAIGVRDRRMIVRHLLAAPRPLDHRVRAPWGSRRPILFEATLSFLGVGVPPPAPSWGGMIIEHVGLLPDGPARRGPARPRDHGHDPRVQPARGCPCRRPRPSSLALIRGSAPADPGEEEAGPCTTTRVHMEGPALGVVVVSWSARAGRRELAGAVGGRLGRAAARAPRPRARRRASARGQRLRRPSRRAAPCRSAGTARSSGSTRPSATT